MRARDGWGVHLAAVSDRLVVVLATFGQIQFGNGLIRILTMEWTFNRRKIGIEEFPVTPVHLELVSPAIPRCRDLFFG